MSKKEKAKCILDNFLYFTKDKIYEVEFLPKTRINKMYHIYRVTDDSGTKRYIESMDIMFKAYDNLASGEVGEVLEELEKIYNSPFDILKLENAPLSAIPQFANFAKLVYNHIQAQAKELNELKKKVIRYLELEEILGNSYCMEQKELNKYREEYHKLAKELYQKNFMNT